ncbi:MAG: hypothetical protein M5U12_05775 [Verrucomicrobia bacterium]|nr:hypothetical protein [Verrucomicrobiota bacterium]
MRAVGGHPVAEKRLARELADTATPERLFERAWALLVLEKVRNRLWAEFDNDGLFDLYVFGLTGAAQTLHLNRGGTFENATAAVGLPMGGAV